MTPMTAPAAQPARPQSLTKVLAAVAARGNHDVIDLAELETSPLGQRLARKMARGDKLTFLLPAFPAKSSNRDKTHGPTPDLGELIGLQNLEAMCAEIEAAYGPGAEVVICSDGRVFHDLVMVGEQELYDYARGIERMIEAYGLRHLRTYSLDDCEHLFEGDEPVQLQAATRFGPTVEDVRAAVKTSPERRSMFNGIHRFMKDDLAFHHEGISRSQLDKRAKGLTYQVMQRSQSWDNLLETIFPEALRLSIHPYPVAHRKFGIKLVPSSDRWATPWHNVTVKIGGRYSLMKRREALALGAELRMHDEEFAFYEVR